MKLLGERFMINKGISLSANSKVNCRTLCYDMRK